MDHIASDKDMSYTLHWKELVIFQIDTAEVLIPRKWVDMELSSFV